ncbi:MAG: metal-dependent transcriptional regulator [Firmicutes bacterium]|nr:metal-dependent transcriptional regulator [Bacillota bacterium]
MQQIKKVNKSSEDYLEAIYHILQSSDHAHSVDIAKVLGVSKPSTFSALKKLASLGLIEKESYGSVVLTKNGEEIAKSIVKKHKAVLMLLVDVLGVSPNTANLDACKIEHSLSEETTQKLFSFLKIND